MIRILGEPDMTWRARTFTAFCLAGFAGLSAGSALAESKLIARWSFETGSPGANAVAGAPTARIERATAAEGHAGKALAFEDWSIKNYLKPDPREATRVVVAPGTGAAALNPAYPFKVSAWIYPTADPVYFGGIVEKGRGLGGSYRLVLLRGLKVEASLGEKHVSLRSSAPISLNAWHEVGLLADGKSLVLLVDGQTAGSLALDQPPRLASTDPLVIGERFTGRIDEVSISSK
jgi:concanavalin A-like lectin/glucanase superfamily protein